MFNELIDQMERELEKRLSVSDYEKEREEIDSVTGSLLELNKVSVWRWVPADITAQGQIIPSVNKVNTLGGDCLWDVQNVKIRLLLSGTFRVTLFTKYLTKQLEPLRLCVNDEPVPWSYPR